MAQFLAMARPEGMVHDPGLLQEAVVVEVVVVE